MKVSNSENVQQTALVIDDSMTNLFLLEAMLKHRGMLVYKEQFPASVMELVERHAPSIIFLDYMMPEKNGLEILAEIREQVSVPIVMVSALTDPAIVEKAKELGIDAYITKPFTTKDINSCCDTLLNNL